VNKAEELIESLINEETYKIFTDAGSYLDTIKAITFNAAIEIALQRGLKIGEIEYVEGKIRYKVSPTGKRMYTVPYRKTI